MSDTFKFIVEKPNGIIQVVKIYSKFPVLACPIYFLNHCNPDDQIQNAISNLKVKLIQDIANAEFEYEK